MNKQDLRGVPVDPPRSLAEQASRERKDVRQTLRALARGTPIRIRCDGQFKKVTFLEMRRTRLAFEDNDGQCYSIPSTAFVEILEHETSTHISAWKATRQLHQACRDRNLHEVKRLLDQGANINARSHENDGAAVPLEDAIEYDAIDIVRLLIERGADVNIKSSSGATPLKMGAVMGNEAIVRELLKHGTDINAQDYYGTALDWANRLHRTGIAKLLVENGVKAVRS